MKSPLSLLTLFLLFLGQAVSKNINKAQDLNVIGIIPLVHYNCVTFSIDYDVKFESCEYLHDFCSNSLQTEYFYYTEPEPDCQFKSEIVNYTCCELNYVNTFY